MKSLIILGLIVLSLPWLTDKMVDATFSVEQGYTQSDIDAVTAMLYPVSHKSKPAGHHKATAGAAQALADVYGLSAKDIAQQINIWGQP